MKQRLALIEEIWASIDADAVNVELLSDAQRAEFEGRMIDESLDEEDLNDLGEIEELRAFSRGRH
jgi:putative addiction module component (TIGR02574 family)